MATSLTDREDQSASDIQALRRPQGVERERELEVLTARIATLEASTPRSAPLTPRTIALLVPLLAALVPFTTAIDAYFKRQSDLQIAAQQQQHAMRMDYLKTALDPDAPAQDREIRLRLLVAIVDANDPLNAWAARELTATQANVNSLKVELNDAAREAARASKEVERAKHELAQQSPSPAPTDPATPPRTAPTTPHLHPVTAPPPLALPAPPAQAKLLDATLRNEKALARARSSAQRLTGKPERADQMIGDF